MATMQPIPVLTKGPFSLDLDKSVKYVTYIFKGSSCGVIVSTLIAMILLEGSIMDSDTTDEEVASMNRYVTGQLLLSLCACGFAIAYFFLCSYLYKGVEERNRTWIFPWFVVTTIIGFCLTVVFFVSFGNGFGIIQLVLPFIIVLVFYSDLLVYSFYVDLGTNLVPELPTQVVPS